MLTVMLLSRILLLLAISTSTFGHTSVVLMTNEAQSTTICRGSNFVCHCTTVNYYGYLQWNFNVSDAQSSQISKHLFNDTAIKMQQMQLSNFIFVTLTDNVPFGNVHIYTSTANMTRVMNETIIKCSEAEQGFKMHTVKMEDLNYPPTLPSMFCKYTTDHKLMLSWDKPHMAEKCCELYNISINRSKNATNTITMENSVTLVIKSEVINASVHCWNSNTETLGPGVDIAIDTGIDIHSIAVVSNDTETYQITWTFKNPPSPENNIHFCRPRIIHSRTNVTCHLESERAINATITGALTANCQVNDSVRVIRVEVEVMNEAGFIATQTKEINIHKCICNEVLIGSGLAVILVLVIFWFGREIIRCIECKRNKIGKLDNPQP